jgi:hypothetical protein
MIPIENWSEIKMQKMGKYPNLLRKVQEILFWRSGKLLPVLALK